MILTPAPIQLALETIGHTGSLAIMRGREPVWSKDLDGDARSASAIGPALEQSLSWIERQDLSLEFVSVAAGPGSFTGLRIATTAAKTLAYAKKLPIVAVDSLAAIAANVLHGHPEISNLVVGLNAYRGQVFTAQFNRQSSPADVESKVLERDPWNEFVAVNAEDPSTYFAGDTKIFTNDQLQSRWVNRRSPDAVGVGIVSLSLASKRQFQDPMSLVPKYIKLSAAEEKHLAT